MDENQFDEFQQAKYTDPIQNTKDNLFNTQNYSNRAEGTLQNHSIINSYESTSPYLNPLEKNAVNINETFKSEYEWPNLNKISSSKDVSNFGNMIDFRKNHSQTEGIKYEDHFRHLQSLQADDTKNELALSYNGINEEYIKTNDMMNSNYLQIGSLNYNQSTQPFGQFQQEKTMSLQQENKIGLEDNNNNQLNHELKANSTEAQDSLNPIINQVPKAQLQQFDPIQQVNQPQIVESFGQQHKSQIVQKEQIAEHIALNDLPTVDQKQVQQARKESQQFVFAQHHAEQSSDRKESQQFVFQAVQTNVQSQSQQPGSRKQSQEFVFQQAVSNPIEQKQDMETITQEVDQEDQFGDFEDVVPPEQSSNQNSQINQSNYNPLNKVEIKEEYLNSSEAEYYKTKQIQLQNFIDALPDYSFLFTQNFT